MITKTRGLVLGHIPYKETSIITRIFTEQYGYQSFVVNSVRSAKSKQGMGFFQPFNLLELVIYMKSSRELQRISEYRLSTSWQMTDVHRQTILLFLAEVIDKLLRNEKEAHKGLFNFMVDGLTFFDQSDQIENFHLQYLLKISEFLGVAVLSGAELFQNMNKVGDERDVEELINALIHSGFQETVPANGQLRFRALETLMFYFRHHVPNFGDVQSLKVLRQIFR